VNVAFGLKAHSGWAVLVVVGMRGGELDVIDRRRIELVEQANVHRARQPYHAAEDLEPDEAKAVVNRGVEAARRSAVREMESAVRRARDLGHDVLACAVLVPEPMPAWSVEEILAVHVRMHKAEGVLFPDALLRAAGTCGLSVLAVPEKRLSQYAEESLAARLGRITQRIDTLGKSVGPPWGKDQKTAALAAVIALQRSSSPTDFSTVEPAGGRGCCS
jgi:hypothetical protein